VIRTATGVALAVLAATPAAAEDEASVTALQVDVTRAGEGWAATFTFAGNEAAAWGFHRSNRARRLDASWRLASWSVETPGVELVREGELDVLRATDGTMPREVRVSFAPFADDIFADYDPALVFSDGAVALFTGHFAAAPLSADGELIDEAEVAFSFDDGGDPLFYKGELYTQVTTEDGGTYVIFGEPPLIEGEGFTASIDSAAPEWIRDELTSFLPTTFDSYTGWLGERSEQAANPTLLASWAGPTAGVTSQGGSVLRDMVIIRLEGEGLLQPSVQALQGMRWFIAHEAAHFWLGKTVAQETQAQAWITEGGASLLAYRLIETIDPRYSAGTELARDWQDCIDLTRGGKSLEGADERREYRAGYACGAVLGMIAEGAANADGEGDFATFTAALIADNRVEDGGDGYLSVEDWLSQLTAEYGDPSLSDQLRPFIVDGVENPATLLCSALARVDRAAPGCPDA